MPFFTRTILESISLCLSTGIPCHATKSDSTDCCQAWNDQCCKVPRDAQPGLTWISCHYLPPAVSQALNALMFSDYGCAACYRRDGFLVTFAAGTFGLQGQKEEWNIALPPSCLWLNGHVVELQILKLAMENLELCSHQAKYSKLHLLPGSFNEGTMNHCSQTTPLESHIDTNCDWGY